MPCSKSSVRCVEGKSMHFDTPPCCRSHIRAMLAAWGAMLTAAGVTWWIDYGTLLGAVRNPLLGLKPGLIPHDKDADIGILGEDQEKVRAMARGPFASVLNTPDQSAPIDLGGDGGICELVWKPPKGVDEFGRGDSFKVRWSPLNHNNVDAFNWYPDGRGAWKRKRYISLDKFKGRELPEAKLFPLTTLEWEGLTVPAPADPQWVAEHRYGPSWRTPLRRNHAGVRVPR